jgi:hypothetical protein
VDAKSTAVCRAAAGVCDVAESCDGSTDTCPADILASTATVCRPAAGTCDLPEHCDGTGPLCPVDSGFRDSDADTVCDALDNCPADPNPGQENGDTDSLGDACDPCTAGGVATKHKLTLSKLLGPAGDDKLSFKAQATLAQPLVPALDPLATGARLLVTGALDGTLVVDATIPAGAYDVGTRTGWKVNGSATSWTYKNPGTHPEGITVVGVRTAASTPGLVKVKGKGKSGTYPVTPANLPLRTTVVLDPPASASGLCVEALWPATPPGRPTCALASAGSVVKCK